MTEIKDDKSDYIRINKDVFFEEGGELMRLKSGAIGKLLSSDDLTKLFDTMSREKIKSFFEQLDRDEYSSIAWINNAIHFLNWEDYSFLKMSNPIILPDENNWEVYNASA